MTVACHGQRGVTSFPAVLWLGGCMAPVRRTLQTASVRTADTTSRYRTESAAYCNCEQTVLSEAGCGGKRSRRLGRGRDCVLLCVC